MIDVENSTKPCGKCGQCPRAPGQRWCRACRAAYKRAHRQRTTAPNPVPQAAPSTTSVVGNTEPLASPDVDHPSTEALNAYRTALAEYERARGLDWRRQRQPPATTLVPLLERVETAKRRCLALGVRPNGKQPSPTPAHQP